MRTSTAKPIALAALLAGASACAPSRPPLPPPSPRLEALAPGERVRVEYAPYGGDARRVSGRLLAIDREGVRIVADQLDTVRVARPELRALWVSRGVQPRAAPVAAGAVIGFVTGVLVFTAAGADGFYDGEDRTMALVFGASAAGAILGASAGAGDYWVPVPLR